MFTYDTVTDNCVVLDVGSVSSNRGDYWQMPCGNLSFVFLLPKRGSIVPHQHASTPPVTSKVRNEFGDKDCTHTNLKGHVLMTTDQRLRSPHGICRYSSWSTDTYYTGVHFPNNLISPQYWSESPRGLYTSRGWNLLVPPHGGTFPFFGDVAGIYRQCRGTVHVDVYPTGAVVTYESYYSYAGYAEYTSKGVISIDWTLPDDPEWWAKARSTVPVRLKCSGYIRTKKSGGTTSKTVSLSRSVNLREGGKYYSPGYSAACWFATTGDKADLFGLAPEIIKKRTTQLQQLAEEDLSRCGLDEVAPWGDLAYDAVQDMRVLTSNEAANVADLVDVLSLVLKPSKLFEKAGEGALDLASSAFLSTRYGLENNVRDISEILNADYHKLDFYVNGARRCRSTKSGMLPSKRFGSWNYRRGLKAYFRPPMDALTFFAYEAWVYGFSLSASTIWDFIPFSFVVDWAVNVGDCFARLDADYFSSLCETRSVLQTDRSQTTVDAGSIFVGLTGTLTLVVFDRHCSRQLPSMPVRLETTPAPSLDHFWEGSALLIQQRRR